IENSEISAHVQHKTTALVSLGRVTKISSNVAASVDRSHKRIRCVRRIEDRNIPLQFRTKPRTLRPCLSSTKYPATSPPALMTGRVAGNPASNTTLLPFRPRTKMCSLDAASINFPATSPRALMQEENVTDAFGASKAAVFPFLSRTKPRPLLF